MKSIEELKIIRDRAKAALNVRGDNSDDIRIVIGMATCGIAAGARPVLNKFAEEIAARHIANVTVTQTGCIGVCQYEPVVEICAPGKEKVTYVNMTEDKVAKVITEHIVNGRVVDEFTIGAYTK